MKFIIFTILGVLTQRSLACLNDKSILPDGTWLYTGVVYSHDARSREFVADGKIFASIITTASDQNETKRFLVLESNNSSFSFLDYRNKLQFEITECSPPPRRDSGYAYFVHFKTKDRNEKKYEQFNAKILVIPGHGPTVEPNESLFSNTITTTYSRGEPRTSSVGQYFKPGYYIGRPTYDGNGKLIVHWGAPPPTRVK